MYRPRTALLVIFAFTLSSVAIASEFRPGEVIVKYKDEKDGKGNPKRTRETMNALYDSIGVDSVRHYTGLIEGYEHLILDEGVDVEDAVRDLEKDPQVAYAQPNYILHALPIGESFAPPMLKIKRGAAVPCVFPGVDFPPGCEDTRVPWPSQQRPDLIDAPLAVYPAVADPELARAYGLKKIGAERAWQSHVGSKDFIVADIDTGIDYNHEDLAFNIWRNPNPGSSNDIVGFDFIHNDGLPFDDQGHGTHTGGTIGAVGGNGTGISGVIPTVSLMSVKFLSSEGSGTTSDAIRSIDYAVSHGAKILSNSWGSKADEGNPALEEVIEKARQADVLFVAAAGNESEDNDIPASANYPASFKNDNVISVIATDQNDRLASFSNYGKTTTHLAAPGVDVYSTVPGNRYKNGSGTSMACPHVAGAAALVWSAHPDWDYRQVRAALLQSVDLLPGLRGKTSTGGRLNVEKALAMRNVRVED